MSAQPESGVCAAALCRSDGQDLNAVLSVLVTLFQLRLKCLQAGEEREADRQTDRQTDRQAGRQAGRQTDIERARQIERGRERERESSGERDR